MDQLEPNDQLMIDPEHERMIAEMISDWLIQIHSDDPDEQQQAQQSYLHWQKQHPEYVYIAKKIEDSFAQMLLLQQQATQHRLLIQPLFKKKDRQTHHRLKYGTLCLVGFITGVIYLQQNTPRYLLADVRSNTGEWRTETLDDGTQITLKNKTAFNINYSDNQRNIELIRGDILVDVAPDQSRPFTVLVNQGSIRALGTKFSVQYQSDHTDVIMLESKVRVRSNSNQINHDLAKERQVQAKERIYLTQYGIQTLPNVDIQNIEYEWLNKTLIAEEQSLVTVLDQLNQSHRGKIYYDRQKLADITVTAVIPLNNTDNAIQLLHNALPQLSIKNFGTYVYWVDISE